MRVRFWFVLVLLAVGACSPPEVTSAELTFPSLGTVYYADVVTITGVARGLVNDGLDVRLLDEDGTVLARVRLFPPDGVWEARLPVSPPNEPMLVTVGLYVTDNATYATAKAMLAPLSLRPSAPAYASVLSLSEGETLGGEQVLVAGMASGVPNNRLLVSLQDANGSLLQQDEVMLTAFNALDEVPFALDMRLAGYRGSAVLTLSALDPITNELLLLDSVAVVVGEAAG
jgi:hypothetical protein